MKLYGAPSRTWNCFIVGGSLVSLGSSTTETPIWNGDPGLESNWMVSKLVRPANSPLGRLNISLSLRSTCRKAVISERTPLSKDSISLSFKNKICTALRPSNASSSTVAISLPSNDRKYRSERPLNALAFNDVIPVFWNSKPFKFVKLVMPEGTLVRSGLFFTVKYCIVLAGSVLKMREPSPVSPTLSNSRICNPARRRKEWANP